MLSFHSVAAGFISVLSKIRPICLKQGMFSLCFSLFFQLTRLKAMLLQIILPVFLISGIEKNSGEQIRILFAGRKDFPFFLTDLLFRTEPQVKPVGQVCIWKIQSLNRFPFNIDTILVSCDRFYRRFLHGNDFLVFPHMVDMVLDCSQGLDQIIQNVSMDAKREIKKIQRQNFSYEITSNSEKVSMFYHDMYEPMVENRFRKTDMFIPDYLTIKFFLQMGFELMLTVLDESYVCGSFFYHHKKVLEVKYSGISQANLALYRKRVSAADQYFIILVALERKVPYLDYGGARPFYHDGLFYYKQKWGTSVQPYSLVPELFGLKICNDTIMRPFLFKNPFIGLSPDDRFVAYVFVDKETFTEKEAMQVEKQYKKPGVDEIRFIKI